VTLAILSGFIWCRVESRLAAIEDFDTCAAAGYPVMESFPPQCRPPAARTFVEDIA